MNFAQAFAQLNAPAPAAPDVQRKADATHAQFLALINALCRSPLVPGTDTLQ